MIHLLKVLSYLPFPVLYILSDLLAFTANYIMRYRRDVVFANLRRSFPDWDDRKINQTARKFYRNLSDLIVETVKALTISQEELLKRVSFKNGEILEEYLSKKQSVIMIAIHQCNWEWMLLAGCLKFPFPVDAVYLPLNNLAVDVLMRNTRSRFGGNPIPASNALMGIMKRSKVVRAFGMLADQVPAKGSDKYWARFLNQDTAFQLGTEQLPKLMKYPVIFLSIVRTKRGFYEVTLDKVGEPPYPPEGHAIMENYIEKAEKLVLDNPSDWLWSHRRWKYKKPLYV